jgi:DNA-binding response OmpR family regulator
MEPAIKEKNRILIVEDEPTLQETLVYNLKHLGYEVKSVGDGNAAIVAARQFKPDLILLDIMLPGIDGFEVCRILRQEMSAPIIFLTARDDEIDRIVGLEIGGDDYISKPFSIRELFARVNARLRMMRLIRQQASAANPPDANLQETKQFGNLVINEARHEISINQQPLALKPKEYELMLFFVLNLRRVISREQILRSVWGYTFTGDSRTVDVHVRWLREKIEEDPSRPNRIVTVRGGGYRFEG